ncbi:MAG: glycosyltransferase family 2 protein [Acidobacteria bacterium]|nr:MAG: glycosyltransferase family 2 protein [Acidobacteriota bacterium]
MRYAALRGNDAMVSILITTYNSANVLKTCLESVLQQDYPDREIILVDNASSDGTRAVLQEFERECGQEFERECGGKFERRLRVIYNETNRGFAAGQNQAIAQAHGDWLFSLNPDVMLKPDFLSTLLGAARSRRIGALCGKLLRWKPGASDERSHTIDSTGIYFLRNLRHMDRGSDQMDRGQYERRELVFGATGAAALYRRIMVEDISAGGEFFDEDFFAYREDADVAWRAQLMGWSCLYVPEAIAWHVRRVTPERFRQLPEEINRHSIKNRFLMRAKNISASLYLRLLIPITARDLLILGYCMLLNRRLLSGLSLFWSKRESIREKRRWVQSHRRVSESELVRWFDNHPHSIPADSRG